MYTNIVCYPYPVKIMLITPGKGSLQNEIEDPASDDPKFSISFISS